MENFLNSKNEGKEFISITGNGKYFDPGRVLSDCVSSRLPLSVFYVGEDEIILNVPENGCGFSMKALRKVIPGRCRIRIFIVENCKRYYP